MVRLVRTDSFFELRRCEPDSRMVGVAACWSPSVVPRAVSVSLHERLNESVSPTTEVNGTTDPAATWQIAPLRTSVGDSPNPQSALWFIGTHARVQGASMSEPLRGGCATAGRIRLLLTPAGRSSARLSAESTLEVLGGAVEEQCVGSLHSDVAAGRWLQVLQDYVMIEFLPSKLAILL